MKLPITIMLVEQDGCPLLVNVEHIVRVSEKKDGKDSLLRVSYAESSIHIKHSVKEVQTLIEEATRKATIEFLELQRKHNH